MFRHQQHYSHAGWQYGYDPVGVFHHIYHDRLYADQWGHGINLYSHEPDADDVLPCGGDQRSLCFGDCDCGYGHC